jgi:hypothetical protein
MLVEIFRYLVVLVVEKSRIVEEEAVIVRDRVIIWARECVGAKS